MTLQVTARPVDGRANRHIITWLAGQFGVPRSRVILEAGSRSVMKRLRIQRPDRIPETLPGPDRH